MHDRQREEVTAVTRLSTVLGIDQANFQTHPQPGLTPLIFYHHGLFDLYKVFPSNYLYDFSNCTKFASMG
jgi:hypothetical protein